MITVRSLLYVQVLRLNLEVLDSSAWSYVLSTIMDHFVSTNNYLNTTWVGIYSQCVHKVTRANKMAYDYTYVYEEPLGQYLLITTSFFLFPSRPYSRASRRCHRANRLLYVLRPPDIHDEYLLREKTINPSKTVKAIFQHQNARDSNIDVEVGNKLVSISFRYELKPNKNMFSN